MNRRQYLVLGCVAVVAAGWGNPVLATAGLLHFALGGVLAAAVPLSFGLVATGIAARFYRTGETRLAAILLAGTLISVAIGQVYGTGVVF